MLLQFTLLNRVMIGVYHDRSRIISGTEETFQGIQSPTDRSSFGTNDYIVGIGVLCNTTNSIGTLQSVDNDKCTTIRHLMRRSEISTHQEIDMLNCLVVMKFQECFLGNIQVFTRQEKVYFLSHFFVSIFSFFVPFGGIKLCFLSLFQLIILKYVAKITIFRQKTLSLQYE